jgi:uncharacterized membrane protein YphA (DoxX/SURF4 family)
MRLDVEIISRFAVGSILVLGALTKSVNFRWFGEVLAKYDLTPRSLVRPMAAVVIVLEFAIGVMILAGIWLVWSSFGGAVLFLVFLIAVWINISRGKLDLPCGCNSLQKQKKIGGPILCRNVGLIGLAVLGSGFEARRASMFPELMFLLSVLLIVFPSFVKTRCQTQQSV